MDQPRKHHSLRPTTTNPRYTRYRVTYSTPFGSPPVSDSASPASDRRRRLDDYDSYKGSGHDARDHDYPPASASTDRTSDRQLRHSDRDISRIHRHHSDSASTRHTRDRQPRPSDRDTPRNHVHHSVSASTNPTSDRQPRPSDRNAPRSDVEQATSQPDMPLEAVKLFLAVMCEGTECRHDEFQTENAAKHLAQDLESTYNVRLSADKLLRKYKLLEENEIRHARPGPEEHNLIMTLHRRRVMQRLEEGRGREEERKRKEEGERRRWHIRPRQSEEQYYRRPT